MNAEQLPMLHASTCYPSLPNASSRRNTVKWQVLFLFARDRLTFTEISGTNGRLALALCPLDSSRGPRFLGLGANFALGEAVLPCIHARRAVQKNGGALLLRGALLYTPLQGLRLCRHRSLLRGLCLRRCIKRRNTRADSRASKGFLPAPSAPSHQDTTTGGPSGMWHWSGREKSNVLQRWRTRQGAELSKMAMR